MKKIVSIMSVYIGLIIGAGFASGREIFEFFNLSRPNSAIGIIVAASFFAIVSYVIMKMSGSIGSNSLDDFIGKTTGPLATMVKWFMLFYMFCGFFVMMSGSGALIEKTFNLPYIYGISFLSLICFVVFSFDLKGLVALNTIMVPVMIVGIFFLCISSALWSDVPTFSQAESLRRNPIVSAICYVAYNTITAGAVLIPLSAQSSKKQLIKAAVLSSSILGVLIFVVWKSLNIYYSLIFESEMPLLDIASTHGKTYSIIYTVVLFMALCTTAVSHGFGIMSKFTFKNLRKRMLFAAGICLSAIPFAKIGFSRLVSDLYSFFGFVGIVWMIWLLFLYAKSSC